MEPEPVPSSLIPLIMLMERQVDVKLTASNSSVLFFIFNTKLYTFINQILFDFHVTVGLLKGTMNLFFIKFDFHSRIFNLSNFIFKHFLLDNKIDKLKNEVHPKICKTNVYGFYSGQSGNYFKALSRS